MDIGSKASSNEEKPYKLELENGLHQHQTLEDYESHLGRSATVEEKERWQQITAQGTTLHTVPSAEFNKNPVHFLFIIKKEIWPLTCYTDHFWLCYGHGWFLHDLRCCRSRSTIYDYALHRHSL